MFFSPIEAGHRPAQRHGAPFSGAKGDLVVVRGVLGEFDAQMTVTGVEFDTEERIEKVVEEVIGWLEGNQLAEVEEYEHKQKELEVVCGPLIAKMYKGGGGADSAGMNDGGSSSDGAGGSGSGGSGPKIEEVN
ncbi:allergen MAG29-like [Asparagus officinalis]|uniref:allergen MAG29-like n=1 Tax=Asparagus officinalis TaxID=4686 RepID=UPI00098DEF6E|nr:allergen MAG29-like [Asparagus officinalis]